MGSVHLAAKKEECPIFLQHLLHEPATVSLWLLVLRILQLAKGLVTEFSIERHRFRIRRLQPNPVAA